MALWRLQTSVTPANAPAYAILGHSFMNSTVKETNSATPKQTLAHTGWVLDKKEKKKRERKVNKAPPPQKKNNLYGRITAELERNYKEEIITHTFCFPLGLHKDLESTWRASCAETTAVPRHNSEPTAGVRSLHTTLPSQIPAWFSSSFHAGPVMNSCPCA